MKLVELLARELAQWPEDFVAITQDEDCSIFRWKLKGAVFRDNGWFSPASNDCGMSALYIEQYEQASDYKSARVTRAQWQAERNRQKGGEWKRHRAGRNQPVNAGVRVEVKLRCGDIQQGNAHEFIWLHSECDVAANIMKYRIISQTQAEDGLELVKGAKDAVISCIAHNDGAGKVTHGPIMMGDEVVGEASPEWNQQAKWDQFDGPLRWRDEVTELNAYIEKYTRERDALIERLASAMSEFSGVDMQDWRNWKAGDIVVCVEDYSKQFTQGKKYELSGLDNDERYPRVQIKADDMGEGNGWGAERFKFHSRP